VHNFFSKQYYILAAAILLSVFCLVQLLRPDRVFCQDADILLSEGVPVTDSPILQQIALPAGIYRVQISYTLSEGGSALCAVADPTVFQGGLAADEFPLSAGESVTDYRLMLFESTSQLQMNLSYNGVGSLHITDVTFSETNQLWSRWLVWIWAAALFFWGCIRFFSSGGLFYFMSADKKNRLLGLALISLFGSLPFLRGSLPYADALPAQLSSLVSLDRNLLYVIPALLYRLGFTAGECHTFYCTVLTAVTACISQYCFEKLTCDYRIGLACCGVYTLSIYRIYRLVLCGLLDEASAYAFLPLVLYSLYLLLFRPRDGHNARAWLILGIGYGGILQTHLPTWLVTAGLSSFICLLSFRRSAKRTVFLSFLKAACVSLLLSLWYLLPLCAKIVRGTAAPLAGEIHTIQEKGIYAAHLMTHFWKLGTEHPSYESSLCHAMPSGLGFIFAAVFLLYVILWFSGKFRHDEAPLTAFARPCAMAGLLCMLLSLRHFPWDKLQFLNNAAVRLVSFLDSPVLFLGWACAALTSLLGFELVMLKRKKNTLYFQIGMLLIIVSLISSPLFLTDYIGRDLPHRIICDAKGGNF